MKPLRALVLGLLLLSAAPGHAEFYAWEDETGRRRVSNLPQAAVRSDGSVRAADHPYSIAAQHAAMRRGLAERASAMEPAPAGEADAPTVTAPLSFDGLRELLAPGAAIDR